MQYSLLLTCALLGFSQFAASQTHDHASMDASVSISLPPCFVSCATQVATAIQCKDISDLACYCKKQEFMIESAKCTLQNCPDQASNSTLTAANFKQLESSCKATTGSFNLTVPTANDLSMTTSANVSADAHAGHGASSSSSDHHAASSSAKSNSPIVASLVPTTVGMAVVMVGSLYLF